MAVILRCGRAAILLTEPRCVLVLGFGFGSTAKATDVTAPPEAEMPVTELLRRAYYFWRASRGHEDESADTLVWDEALDALLDRLLEERPELKCRT